MPARETESITIDEYGFFRGNLWSALIVRVASVTSVKVARRGTFDASTSPSAAADTCLRQSGDQVPSLDGQYAISRSCGLRGIMSESRTPTFDGRRGHRLAEKHQICGASAISGHERHFWTWLAHGRGRLGWKFFQTAFWGVRGLPKSFLGMCLAFRDSDVERINSRNSARASGAADYICSPALLRG